VLAAPDENTQRTKVADWLELKAIASPDGRVAFATLISATALTQNEENEDIADEDAKNEGLVLAAQAEIDRRLRSIGVGYPFRIVANARALEFRDPLSRVGAVYLFCLFLSHAFDRTIIPQNLAPEVTNEVRDLFQVCSTVAAGGYVNGPAVSFGFPRPDGKEFLRALRRVYRLFGDGRPCRKPRKASPPNVKDSGIDIIAWRRPIDRLPGTHYLIGQVASGLDWEDKSVKADREHFHKYWFVETPASQAEDAMFMPFGLEPENEKAEKDYEALLRDHMQSVGYKFGTLFYRDRIARHVGDGLQLIANGEELIERHQELAEVEQWVEAYRQRLRAA
jgi:hypothetical protein